MIAYPELIWVKIKPLLVVQALGLDRYAALPLALMEVKKTLSIRMDGRPGTMQVLIQPVCCSFHRYIEMKPQLFALGLLAALLAACTGAPPAPQADIRTAESNPACPDLHRWPASRLYGQWLVELPGLGQSGTLLLRQHPEFGASLRGEFELDGHHSIASGDLEEGELNLDESRDGKSLHAFWSGHLVVARCGQEVRGLWQQVPGALGQTAESPFVLKRLRTEPGW